MKKLTLGTVIFAILVFAVAVSAMDELTGTDNSIAISLSSTDAAALAEAKQDDSTAYDAEIVINGSSYTGTIQAASMEDMKAMMTPPEGSEGSEGPQGNPPQGDPNGQGPQGGPQGAPQGAPNGQGPQGGPQGAPQGAPNGAEAPQGGPQGNPPEKPQGDFGEGQAPDGMEPMVSYKITIDSTEILLSAMPEMPEMPEGAEKPADAPDMPEAVEAELTINDGSALKVRITQNKQTTK